MKSDFKIFDYHVHTQFAYCSQNDMLPDTTTKIAEEKGYGICLSEHAGQLYVKSEDFWNENIVNKPELLYVKETSRMNEYIDYVSKYKNEGVILGLELDINCDGKPTILDEHKSYFDIFLGAIHYIPEQFSDIDKGFLWSIDAIGNNDIDILAHPFRIYKRRKLPIPVHLYEKVAKALSKYNLAAEINYHINEPDLDFFRLCIENGVKISFGSDAHKLAEVCSFERYFDFLDKIHSGRHDDILFDHKKRSIK